MIAHDEQDGHGSIRQMAIIVVAISLLAFAVATVSMYVEYPPVRAKMNAYFAEKIATLATFR